MNASLWQLAGWTMIHSLWLGAAVALLGGFLRVAARRAAPNVRYAISLATLALLAATPIAAAAWLGLNGVPQLAEISPSPRYSGERLGEGLNLPSTTPQTSATVENPSPNPSLQGRGTVGTPGKMPGLSAQVIDLARTSPSPRYSGERLGEGLNPPSTTPHTSATVENPSPNPSHPGRGIAPSPPSAFPIPPTDHQPPITSHLSPFIPHLPTLWLIGAPLTFTLLATGLVGSARLRRRATPLLAGPAHEACERLRQTLKITRRVALAVSDGVAQPILVGVLRPLILLPAAALAGWTPEQLDMVLLHELAHVRRRDNLVNLMQRIVESILFYHPAVWLVSRQVRRDREECCDAAVIRHTDRPHLYAELLVSIAAALRGGPAPSLAVASAMASHPLAGRIRRILNIEEEPMRITRRTLAATLLLPALLAGAMLYSGANAEDASNPPPSKGGARGGIPDASNSKMPSSEEKRGDKPRQAAPANDDPETAAPLIRIIYPIKSGTLIDPLKLAEAIGDGVEMQTIKSKDSDSTELSIIISAPQKTHDRVHALLSQPKLMPAAPRPETALASSLHLGITILQPPKWIDRGGRFEGNTWTTTYLKVPSPLPLDYFDEERITILKAALASEKVASLQSVKKQTDAVTWLHQRLHDSVDGEVLTLQLRYGDGPDDEVILQAVIDAFIAGMKAWASPAGDPGSLYWNSAANNVQPPAKTAPASIPSADAAAPYASVEIPLLQDEIRNLQSLILKTQEDLTNIKVFKELAIQNSQNPAAIDAAVSQEIESDRELRAINDRILVLDRFIDSGQITAAKNDELKEQRKKFEREKEARQSELMKSARERVAEKQKDDVRQATDEFNIRRQAIDDNIAKYKKDLEAAKTELLQLGAVQPAPIPQPVVPPSTYRAGDFPTIREFPANADMQEVNAAVDKLKAEGRQVAIEQKGDGRKRIVDTAVRSSKAWNNSDSPNKTSAANNAAPRLDTNPDAGFKDIIIHFPPNFPNSDQERQRIRESLAADGFKASSTTLRVGTTSAVTGEAETQLIPCLRVFVPKDWKAKPVWETKIGANGEQQATLRLINEPNNPAHPPVDPAPPYSSYSAAPIQSSTQAAPPTPAEDESPTLAEFLKAFAVQADNPVVTREFHTAGDRRSIDLLLHAIGGHPNANNVELEWKWLDNGQLELKAPEQAHAILKKEIPDDLLQYVQERFSPFPTLENQKIADRAYKLLGLELDPLAPEELKRVKKLGYTGGLRVTRGNETGSLQPNDLLVGLHVWPITDLKSLDEVLQRDDLGELNPLKYYVIRKTRDSAESGGGGSRLSGGPMKDTVVTGRLQIPDAELLSRGLEQTNQAMSQLAANAPAAGDLNPYANHAAANTPNAAKFLPSDAKPASDFASISIVQAPVTQKTGLFGGTVTTAYLKVKFDRLTGAFDNADRRLTPQEIERNAMNCLAIVESPGVLQKALNSLEKSHEAIETLQKRLSATFPGDGEILEIKLESGDAKEDRVLLQAIIDAFIAAMKNPPESPSADQTEAGNLDNYEQAAAAGHAAQSTYLYDGKTFEQWRDLWKLELNPERRTEAINALAAFGRTGHGQEAADAILAVAGEYPEDYSPTSSEGKLLAAIRQAVARMPAQQWMPPVQARIADAEEPEKSRWIRRAGSFMDATNDSSDEARELAVKFAEIPSDALLTATALYLYRSDQSFEKAETIELMRRALQQKSPGIDVTFLGFRHLDKVPEQLDVLLRVPHARVRLRKPLGTAPAVAARLYPPLLEILKNPDRTSDHVGALRALGSVASVIRNDASSEASLQIMKELVEMLRAAPDEQLPAVLVTYGKYWGSADYQSIINSLEEQKQLSPEQAKRLRNLSEQSLFEESHAE